MSGVDTNTAIAVCENISIFWQIQINLFFILIKPMKYERQVYTDFRANVHVR